MNNKRFNLTVISKSLLCLALLIFRSSADVFSYYDANGGPVCENRAVIEINSQSPSREGSSTTDSGPLFFDAYENNM